MGPLKCISSTSPHNRNHKIQSQDKSQENSHYNKYNPRTKYINSKYWHIRYQVEQLKISIYSVSTTEKVADLLTKLLAVRKSQILKERSLDPT